MNITKVFTTAASALLFILFSLNSNAQDMSFYKKKWAKVDSVEKKGLPKSALEIVNQIHSKAQKDNLSEQVIKSFIHRLKYKNAIEENAFEKLCYELDSAAQKADFPDNAVMHSMLADMYFWYYQNNRYKFMNRSNTLNFKNNDMQTWTLDHLVNKIIQSYSAALSNAPGLQKIPVTEYPELISLGTKPNELYPTLYDYLAHKAVDFYSNPEMALSKPADYFQMREDFYFADTETYVKTDILSSDTLSMHFHAQCVLQDLLKFRLSKKSETNALFAADFKRLSFAYNNSVNSNKDELYIKALNRFEQEYKAPYAAAEIKLAQARYFYTESSKYDPQREETRKYKEYRTKAIGILNELIKKYPKQNATAHGKQLKENILQKSLSFKTENYLPAGKTFASRVTYKNTEKLYVRVAQISKKKYERIKDKKYGTDLYDKLLSASDKVYEFNKNLPKDPDYNEHSVELLFEGLNTGFYLIFIADNPDFKYNKAQTSYNTVYATNISYFRRDMENGDVLFTLVHRDTGKPLHKVKCDIWHNKYNYTLRKYKRIDDKTVYSDKNGQFVVEAGSSSESYYVDFTLDKDEYSTASSVYLYEKNTPSYDSESIHLFTDRAIYRPGQTVYFKGIKLRTTGKNKHKIVSKSKVKVLFKDANSQKVSELELTTNEYGTFSGTFDIPVGLLNGTFTIYTARGSKTIRVEEYKRPKFEVETDKFDGNYLLGDEVELSGKAISYSGAALSDAEVTYRITRSPKWRGWWYWSPPAQSTEIAHGKSKTDDKGKFKIKFEAIPDLSLPKNEFTYFSYKIEIDVTDLNGETQSTSSRLNVGYRALKVGLPLSGLINSDADKYKNKEKSAITVTSENFNNEFIPASGEIKIFKLKDTQTSLRDRAWQIPDKYIYSKKEWQDKFEGNEYKDENELKNMPKGKEVFSTAFNTKNKKSIDGTFISKLRQGHYTAEIKSKDAFGNEVSNKHFFSITDASSKKMPFKSPDLFENLKTACEPGEKAQWLIGSSEKVSVLYEVEHKGKVVHSERIKLKNEQKKITLPVKEKHRGNVSVSFTFVKNNRFYTHNSIVFVPHSDKKLDIEFMSFRDKLYPGQDEQWKIKIKGPKGEKVAAEMLATLYDASLDQFAKNHWSFNIYSSYYTQLRQSSNAFGVSSASAYQTGLYQPKYPTRLTDPAFNWYGFSYWSGYSYDYGNGAVVRSTGGRRPLRALAGKVSGVHIEKSEEKQSAELAMDDTETTSTDSAVTRNDSEEPAENEKKEDFSDVKVRTNFNETAFFFPNLETDSDGNIIINFTVPESLTKWRMMGFAVSKDLKYGIIENELITQKELMLVPNSPRFFRESDKITFPVKISNVSEENMSGNVKLELLDAMTMKPLSGILAKGENASKAFDVKSGSNTLVSWDLEIPEGAGVIAYKVVAKSGKFSDGEQKPVPVLTNRMLVTESLPLPLRGKESKEYKFEKLINSGKSSSIRHHKLTLEYTSNPAWYAVQALPYMMEYPYECTEQTFSRYYANSLASSIANSDPKIKAVFDSWKNTADSKALLSNLEKNQELKAVLLEQTPWVLAGKNESERKKRVGLLFDLNRMSNEMARALRKVQKAQKANGAWPWFDGMPESRYITQYIVTGFGRLDNLGVKSIQEDAKTRRMLKKAVAYLDSRIDEDYDWLKRHYNDKEMKENHLSYTAIHYLYGRSYFTEVPISDGSREAFNYFKSQAEKYWLSQSQYMQGMIALSLHRFGDKKAPSEIMKSLKEYSTSHDELGMYWKNNVAGYYWYQAPIEFQALMIEAFDEVMNDKAAVYDMKIWLLKQKQTQDWKTTRATAEAVYALLLRGGNWLASDKLVEVKLDNKIIDPKKLDNVKAEAGTGYFKTSWSGNEVKPEMGNVTVSKEDEGVAWGALYWQYFEDLDKITLHETPLKLKKKLFKEINTEHGKVIKPVSESDVLEVGDKIIVRIELRSDRRMEYIHMKDMRASGFEPINVISRYKWQDGLGYYESTKDASTDFFMESLPKGTYVFEYPLRVSHKGNFSNGITSIQCMYAPEFGSHSEGIRVSVK